MQLKSVRLIDQEDFNIENLVYARCFQWEDLLIGEVSKDKIFSRRKKYFRKAFRVVVLLAYRR